MPKYYCDYCDIFLTHDSASVRKAHNSGWKHALCVKNYYADLNADRTQEIIDKLVTAYEARGQQPPQDLVSFSGFGPGMNIPASGLPSVPMSNPYMRIMQPISTEGADRNLPNFSMPPYSQYPPPPNSFPHPPPGIMRGPPPPGMLHPGFPPAGMPPPPPGSFPPPPAGFARPPLGMPGPPGAGPIPDLFHNVNGQKRIYPDEQHEEPEKRIRIQV